MNIDNKTTREQALEWFNSKASLEKTRLCDTNTEIVGKVRRWETLTGREIEQIYLSEHPTQPEQTIKENAKWYLIPNSFKPLGDLKDCIMAEMGINVIDELEKENKELKEENKLLREALEIIITSPEWIKNYGGGAVDKKAKSALNQ